MEFKITNKIEVKTITIILSRHPIIRAYCSLFTIAPSAEPINQIILSPHQKRLLSPGDFEKLLKYIFNAATGYLRKSGGIQTKEQGHRTFSNLDLKGKLSEAVQFVCEW